MTRLMYKHGNWVITTIPRFQMQSYTTFKNTVRKLLPKKYQSKEGYFVAYSAMFCMKAYLNQETFVKSDTEYRFLQTLHLCTRKRHTCTHVYMLPAMYTIPVVFCVITYFC